MILTEIKVVLIIKKEYSKDLVLLKICIIFIIFNQNLLSDLLSAIYKYRTTDRDELHNLSPNTIYDRSVYERRFGTWSNALKLAGFTDYNRVLLSMFEDYKGEEPVEFLISKIGKNGNLTNKQMELLNANKITEYSLRKHFKYTNFYKILKGQTIKGIYNLTIKQTALDGHVCDSYSEKLVDDFLFKNGFKHEIHVKYPNDKKICDFIVNGIYIEYAGFYNSSAKYNLNIDYKIKFCKENNLKLYILYDTSKKSLENLKSFILSNSQPGGFNE